MSEVIAMNWTDDCLRREQEARFLTDYLSRKFNHSNSAAFQDSFVLNLSSPWGTGKTYFLRKWTELLKQENYPVVTFNAWESDYTKEPLIAFVAQIRDSLKEIAHKIAPVHAVHQSFLENKQKMLRGVAPILIEIAAKKLTGLTVAQMKDLRADNLAAESETEQDDENHSEKVGALVEKMLDDQDRIKESVNQFKQAMAKLVTAIEQSGKYKLPLFVMVDELDRCRPTYALEFLEHVKHLFGIRGVYFVVASDTDQLVNSVGAIYGQKFDGARYIRRFFSQEYRLATVEKKGFIERVVVQLGGWNGDGFCIPAFAGNDKHEDKPISAISEIAEWLGCSLRDIEQALLVMDAIRLTSPEQKRHLVPLIFLILLNVRARDLFAELEGWPLVRDSVTWWEKFNGRFPNRYFTVNRTNSNGSIERKSCSWSDFLKFYFGLAETDRKHLNDRYTERHANDSFEEAAFQLLSTDRLNQFEASQLYPNQLANYRNLVMQAGHLSIPGKK